ncbi:MAG: hypothetical protein ACI4TP_07730 [Anaerotignum sp.]
MNQTNGKYDDIINLPHHQSARRPHMSLYHRAAQFAPFAALVGYDEMVRDAADTLTLDKRVILDENEKRTLDKRIRALMKASDQRPKVKVCYFDDSANGLGGAYVSYIGIIKKIESYPTRLVMMDGKEIFAEDILNIEEDIARESGDKSLK